MKTKPFDSLALAIACSLAVLPLARGADNNPPAANEASFNADWAELKDYTYDRRDLFLAGLQGLEVRVKSQIAELEARRATMDASNTSTKDWDFAMQEMSSANTNLKSANNEMARASRDTWDQQKDKVGLAWVRTQDAYAKVKASTTK